MTQEDVIKYIENKLINDPNTLQNNIRFLAGETRLYFYNNPNPSVPFCVINVIPHYEHENKFKIRLNNVSSGEHKSMFITFINGVPTWDEINKYVE